MSKNNSDNALNKSDKFTVELGFYKDQTEYYKRSIEDLLHHYTDNCGVCTVNLDCSECVMDDFINQLRNILYSSSEYKGENI
jgi:hypothetical protein